MKNQLIFIFPETERTGEPVATFRNAITNQMRFITLDKPRQAQYAKVEISESEGWPVLTEFSLYKGGSK